MDTFDMPGISFVLVISSDVLGVAPLDPCNYSLHHSG